MADLEQVKKFVQERYSDEADSSDRITDQGFAFYVNGQPREFLDTNDMSKMLMGGGPLIIPKETNLVYSFNSAHQMIFVAKTAEEFNAALTDLKDKGNYAALNPQELNVE